MSQREEIIEKIIERGAPLFGKEPTELSEETTFEEVDAKSVHFSQITTYLEDEFDIEVPYMQFRRRKTIGEAADYVEELLENE